MTKTTKTKRSFWDNLFRKKHIFSNEEYKILLEILSDSEYMKNKGNNMDERIVDLYKDLKSENRIINDRIETTKWLLTILISVFGLFTPLMFSLHSRSIDSKFETINKTIEQAHQETQNEIKLLHNDFKNLKELNKVEIEKEVLKNIKH